MKGWNLPTIYSTLSWRIHIDHLTTKLSTACYVIRSINPLPSQMTLLLIYHSLFLRVMSYRIKFGGNFCHSIQIFWMQKRATGIFFLQRTSCFIIKLKENKTVSSFSQTQRYTFIFILFYLDNTFWSIDHHQATLTKLRIRILSFVGMAWWWSINQNMLSR
jgi:hypothetical protein